MFFSSAYLDGNGNKMLPTLNVSPTKSPYTPSCNNNYDNMHSYTALPPPTSVEPSGNNQYGIHQQSLYLNVPQNSKVFKTETFPEPYTPSNSQPSPLPPPPPLPSYNQLQHANQSLLQPTPLQVANGHYLDLSRNRENRGSAFEVYRKPSTVSGMNSATVDYPMGGMHHQPQQQHSMYHPAIMSAHEAHMFSSLPPPPPPLTVNDYK